MNTDRAIITVCLVASLELACFRVAFAEITPHLAELSRSVATAHTDTEIRDSVAALLRASSDQDLDQLLSHPNDGVAFFAAWEQVRRQMETSLAERSEKSIQLEQLSLARFIGIVEGRLEQAMPESWRQQVLSALPEQLVAEQQGLGDLLTESDHSIVTSFSYAVPPSPYKKLSDFLWAPPDFSLSGDGKNEKISSQRLGVTLSIEFLKSVAPEWGRHGPHAIDGLMLARDRLIIVCFGEHHGGSYIIACVDPIDQEVIWVTKVMVLGRGGGSTGDGLTHRVDLRRHEECVVVIGAGWRGSYIEAFNLIDGGSVFRFSTEGIFRYPDEVPVRKASE
jgi:hypothetical protein